MCATASRPACSPCVFNALPTSGPADAETSTTIEQVRSVIPDNVYVTGITAVTDDEILDAMRLLFDRMKLVVEPSGALAVAALLAGRLPTSGRIGIIISGGNISAEQFCRLLGQASQ